MAAEEVQSSKTKVILQILGLIALFLFSFVLFLFLTFPYEVLKESLAAEISQSTGLIVRIGDMSADFPLGMTAEKVKIEAPNGAASMSFKSLSVDVAVLKLLLGKVAVEVSATEGAGELEVDADFGFIDLIGGQPVPKRFRFQAKSFPLDDLVGFALNNAASSPTANPMVAPLLSAIGVSALLNGKADFALDAKNPTQSTGEMEISLAKAILKLSHPSLGLPDQEFKSAKIGAKVESGNVVFAKNSGFVSDELELLTEGKIALKQQPLASQLDMKVVFRLNKGLKEKFGFLIDAMTGSATSEGQLTMQLRGPMEQPAVTTF